MTERPPRLGDMVDDYCSRCRIVTNHGVVGLVGAEVRRVRCQTCLHEHAYRHGQIPKPRKDKVKDLFDQVLARIPQTAPPAAQPTQGRRRTPHLGRRDKPGGGRKPGG